MNFCKNCGATLDPGVKFCKSCGAPAQPPANSRPSFCRGCGAPLNPNARFCKVCGLPAPAIMKEPEPAKAAPAAPAAPAPAAPEPAKAAPVKAAAPALHCAVCGAELLEKHKFCPNCGRPVSNAPVRLCPSCGKPVREDHAFCPFCGVSVPAAEKPAADIPEPPDIQGMLRMPEFPPVHKYEEPKPPAAREDERKAVLPTKPEPPAVMGKFCMEEPVPPHDEENVSSVKPAVPAPESIDIDAGNTIDLSFGPAPAEPVIEAPAAPKPAVPVPAAAPEIKKAAEQAPVMNIPSMPVPPAAPATGVCLGCGAPLKPGKNFCSKCGRPVSAPAPEDAPTVAPFGLAHAAAPVTPVKEQAPVLNTPTAPVPPTPAMPAKEQAPVLNTPAAPAPGGICLGCGAPLKPGRNFCSKCGRPVNAPAPEDAPTVAPFAVNAPSAPAAPVKEQAPVMNAPAAPVPPTPPAPGGVCLGCGAPLKPGRNFCSKCGRPVNAPAPEDAPTVAPFAVNAPSAPAAPVKEQAPVMNAPAAPVPPTPPAPGGVCLGCGAPLKPGRNFCSKCGRPVNAPAPQDAPTVAPFAVNAPSAPVAPVKEQAPVLNIPSKPVPEAPASPAPSGICLGCGAPLKPGRNFCSKCGRPVNAPAPQDAPTVAPFAVNAPAAPVTPVKEQAPVLNTPTAPIPEQKPVNAPAAPVQETAGRAPEPLSGFTVCTGCGAVVTPGKRFCARCGKPVSAPVTETVASPVRPADSTSSVIVGEKPKFEPVKPAPVLIPDEGPDLDLPESVTAAPEISAPKIEIPDIPEVKIDTPAVPEVKIEAPVIPEVKVEAPVIPEPKIEIPDIPEVKVEAPVIPEPRIEIPDIPEVKIETPRIPEPVIPAPVINAAPVVSAPAVQEEEDLDVCAYCGNAVKAGTKICTRCGKEMLPLPPSPLKKAAPAGPICAGCGTVLSPGNKFCIKCGRPVSAQAANPIPVPNAGPVCSGCGAVLQPGKRFCHKCGKPVGR